jgi:hypothetical protein
VLEWFKQKERLPTKCEVLSSKHSAAKKKGKKEQKTDRKKERETERKNLLEIKENKVLPK